MKFVSNRALIVVVLTLSVWLTTALVHSVQAQTKITESVINDWDNPGSFPFEGKFDDVCTLYKSTLTSEQCARAYDQHERGLGTEMFLQDGDILQISFTVNGEHKQKTLRVAFGPDVPADHPDRRAMVYDTGRQDGVKLVRPDICGNWSVMTVSETPPEPTIVEKTVERIIVKETIVAAAECKLPGAHTISSQPVFVPSTDSCNCGVDLPAILVQSGNLPTYASGCVE